MLNFIGNITKNFGRFTGNLDLNIGKFSLPIPYWQAISIVFLLFLLIVMMAQFRRHYVDWSFKGAIFGILFGFILALILEGFLIIGGRTILTSVLGWRNPPPVILQALDIGRSKLVQVLGMKTEIPSSYVKTNTSVQETINLLQRLNPNDTKVVKSIFCK